MKEPSVRIEVMKGDARKDIPWVRMVRVIERDRTQKLYVQKAESAEELLLNSASLTEIVRTSSS